MTVIAVLSGAQDLQGWVWGGARECPIGVPAQVLIDARVRDPRNGKCFKPILEPVAEPTTLDALAKELNRRAGIGLDTKRLATPYAAAWWIYWADHAARVAGQRAFRAAGFGGAVCGLGTVRASILVCALRTKDERAAEALAEGWRNVPASVLTTVREERLDGLDEPAIVADSSNGWVVQRQMILAFQRGHDAYLLVAGPSSPSEVHAALTFIATRLRTSESFR
jgi:hypothetical protein